MEQQTKNQKPLAFEGADFHRAFLMAAFSVVIFLTSLALGASASATIASVVTMCACLASFPLVGTGHYGEFLDGTFTIGKGTMAALGLLYFMEGLLFPSEIVLPVLVMVKQSFVFAIPWGVIAVWMGTSILEARKKRIEDERNAAFMRSVEETLRQSREVTAQAEVILRRSDEILRGDKGSAPVA